MSLLLSLLLIAEVTAPPAGLTTDERRHSDAKQIYHCGFEQEDDADFDHWPDRWTRRRGANYPGYLPVEISAEDAKQGDGCLEIRLNGGGAAIYSPAVDEGVGPLFSYVLEGYVQTIGLERDKVYFSVTFFDENGNMLETIRSDIVTKVPEWRKIRMPPMIPRSTEVASAVIGLHVEPTEKQDIHGVVRFDDVWFARLPRMSLRMNRPDNVYTNPKQVSVACEVSGIFERDPEMVFELLDQSWQRVDYRSSRLDGEAVARRSSKGSELFGIDVTKAQGFRGSADWSPEIRDSGFYRLRVQMKGRDGLMLERHVSLVVVEPKKLRPGGQFGWTLPDTNEPLNLATLSQLLPHAGINWVKFPAWYGDRDAEVLDRLVAFAERLSDQGVESVGILSDPPPDVQAHFAEGSTKEAIDIFSAEADVWYPAIEPVMTRLGLQVRYWQLGVDRDTSFVGASRLPDRIGGIKKQLQRFGQEVHLGIGWRVIHEPNDDGARPWDFLTLGSDPPLTDREIDPYLSVFKDHGAARWLTVEPLPRNDYPVEVRIRDLVHRMLAAKMAGAEGIFVSNPFDPQTGVMREDGTPDELLLPWRTTALVLAGAEYVGSIALGSGSTNYLFARDGEMVMVVWNERETKEKLFLGEEVRQTDVWGRSRRPATEDKQHVIPVGPLPTFITGINSAIARWNMLVNFERIELPSLFGTQQSNSFVVINTFPQGVTGQVTLRVPDDWKVEPRNVELKLATGEEAKSRFLFTLPFDASSGRQKIDLDFDVNADRHYHFSVHRHLDIGVGDVALEVTSHMNENGELEVQQRVTNHTEGQVSFKCQLVAPGRRRQVSQVVKLGQEQDTKIYRFAKGRELLGKQLWLRCEEVGGQRVLNQRFVAEE